MLRHTYTLQTSKSLKSTGNIGTISFHQTEYAGFSILFDNGNLFWTA